MPGPPWPGVSIKVASASRPASVLKDDADVVQARDERRPVDSPAAARPVREADDVRAVLAEPDGEREPLRVIDERDEAFLAVAVVAHEHGKFAVGRKDCGAILQEL